VAKIFEFREPKKLILINQNLAEKVFINPIADRNFFLKDLHTTFMYKNSCGFVCEDFPKENQTLQTRNDL